MIQILQPGFLPVAVILLLFSFLANKSKVLSIHGILFANLIGIFSYVLAGIGAFVALVVFYVAGEAATRIPNKDFKHEQRTESNIFGNCAAAVLALLFGNVVAFFGAISAAMADTLSSEIGVLSKTKPVLITNLQVVEKGTNGAVTLLGLLAAFVSSILIACVYYLLVANSTSVFAALILAGISGTLVDSFLGATVQKRGILGNNGVNFFASASGALVIVLLSNFI